MKNMIEKIRAEIEQHQTEIERLEIALAVCLKLEKAPEPKAAPMFTVRKRVEKQAAKPISGRHGKAASTIVALLTKRGEPLTTQEIIEATGINNKTVWNAMYGLRQSGRVVQLAGRRHALAEHVQKPVAESGETAPVAQGAAA